MTLTLVSDPSIGGGRAQLLEALSLAGVRVDEVPSSAASTAADTLALLDGPARLALVRGPNATRVEDDIRIAAVLPRTEPRDVLVPAVPSNATLQSLPTGSRVWVEGLRRAAFLRAHRRDLVPLLADNGTGPREALESGEVDAVIMGGAACRAHGLAGRATQALEAKSWVPGPAQGAALLLCRSGDDAALEAAGRVGHLPSEAAVSAERSVGAALGLSGADPVGILAQPFGNSLRLWGMAASPDGRRIVRGDLTGSLDNPGGAGEALTRLLLARGAAEVLGSREG